MSENDLKRDYERIYLTDELGEVNWCQDRLTKEDVEYVRSDILTSDPNQLGSITLSANRWLSMLDTLGDIKRQFDTTLRERDEALALMKELAKYLTDHRDYLVGCTDDVDRLDAILAKAKTQGGKL